MVNPDQLEIIYPDGVIEFYVIDPARGIINLGQHPDNDIVIESEKTAPFHAVLDHRRKPLRLLALNEQGPTYLNGQKIASNIYKEIHHHDIIEIDGCILVFLEGDKINRDMRGDAKVASPEGLENLSSQLMMIEEEVLGLSPSGGDQPQYLIGVQARPPDKFDEIIVTEAIEREFTVDVEQTVVIPLTIINGGGIVANFDIRVEGLNNEWVEILPDSVNLFEGERTTVNITITPPRQSSALADAHHFAIIITSVNHPNRISQLGGTLFINPFYDFAVGELYPKRQQVTWFKKSGELAISLLNRGNNASTFRLEGSDDDRALNFEFQVPGEDVMLAAQAETRLHPEGKVLLPIKVTPNKPRLIGFRKRTYPIKIATTLLEGSQPQRSVLGELTVAPLIGPWLIFLIVFLVGSLVGYVSLPRIEFLESTEEIVAGQTAQLSWRYFPPFTIGLQLDGEPVIGESTITRPVNSTRYELVANTWISRVFPVLAAVDYHTVSVIPVKPEILLFESEPGRVTEGETFVLSWLVINADTVVLVNQTDATEEIVPPTGSREIVGEKNVVYTLRAINSSLSEFPIEQPVNIAVFSPSPTPPPLPVIDRFIIVPEEINAGESISLEWDVTGATNVSIEPIGAEFPGSGAVIHAPEQTTFYVLSATNGFESVREIRQVKVNPLPTPVPPPTAPKIELFSVTPEEIELVIGGSTSVRVDWLVTGPYTDVSVSYGPLGENLEDGLDAIGNKFFNVKETTRFVMIASNGSEQAVAEAEVKIALVTPTPTPTNTATATPSPTPTTSPTVTPTPSNTPTPTPTIPPPTIIEFVAEPSDPITGFGKVRPVTVLTNTVTYEVEAGTDVTIRWEASAFSTVTFQEDANPPVSTAITGTLPVPYVTADHAYVLTVNGNGPNQTKTIQLQVVPQTPPHPPFNVNGTFDQALNDATLTWEYNRADLIVGFRVYAKYQGQANFSVRVDENFLTNVPNGSTNTQWVWTDTTSTRCAEYKVKAVYFDILGGVNMETDFSTNTWKTTCP